MKKTSNAQRPTPNVELQKGQLAKIDPPSLRSGEAGDHQDKLMGEQLTVEFSEAVNGMWRVVRVGAMMMGLRARVVSNLDTTAKRGPTAKDTGMKAWLEKYAPKVNRATAYRFEDVAKAVAQRYALPARVAKKLTFEQLVTADPKDLDPVARKAQAELNGFVAGTSQTSWLDQFREAKSRGGDTSGSHKKLTPAEERAQFLQDTRNDFAAALQTLDRLNETNAWQVESIEDAEREAGAHLLHDLAKKITAWLKTPRSQRKPLQDFTQKNTEDTK